MTLYEYLEKNWDNATIDHSVRVVRCSGGEIEFYIHPDGKDGDTPSFVVTKRTIIADIVSIKQEDDEPPPDEDGPDRLIHHNPDGLLARFDEGLT